MMGYLSMQEHSSQILPDSGQRGRLRKWRNLKDRVTRYGVGAGGYSVIFALTLIFVFLFMEVMPIFKGAKTEPVNTYQVGQTHEADAVHMAIERYMEGGVLYGDDLRARFFNLKNGQVRLTEGPGLPEGVDVTAFGTSTPASALAGYGLSNGHAYVLKHNYNLHFNEDNVRDVVPEMLYPLGKKALEIDPQGRPLKLLALQGSSSGTGMAAVTEDNRLFYTRFRASVSFMTGETEVKRTNYELGKLDFEPTHILLNQRHSHLVMADAQSRLHYYDISDPRNPQQVQSVQALDGAEVTAMEYLIGTVSVLVGGSDGSVTQWLPVRGEDHVHRLRRHRGFEPHDAAVVKIVPEYNRKGFVTGAADGTVAIHYATSERTVLRDKFSEGAMSAIGLAPRNNGLAVMGGDHLVRFMHLDNHHPEISWSVLWEKVWYEGRTQPEYVWQSSSSSDDFESKFSLIPLTLGTLKAAFYAMLFAIPIAVMGAIYTAYFMTARMRGIVKPIIEIMEALPTVILGFLAGLWLAPFVENNLPSVFSILLLLPVAMLLFAYGWGRLPGRFRNLIGEGWEAALLVPSILIIGWLCVSLSPLIEVWFFDGSMRQWFTEQGITYDQRNAMVVGIAMGFAVIPTIFSIAEDAVFNVPRHLTQGSLALGATPWQTMTRVVLLTASPGIFSAVMMGFGRAVGETMIVLMATGNSPVVNFNIFEGMRTLSANIAVEMPETAVGSTHYRILYLAALVLFAITFAVNTLAELVRQRLRKRYSEL
jgi:phosphate transport system permease protein